MRQHERRRQDADEPSTPAGQASDQERAHDTDAGVEDHERPELVAPEQQQYSRGAGHAGQPGPHAEATGRRQAIERAGGGDANEKVAEVEQRTEPWLECLAGLELLARRLEFTPVDQRLGLPKQRLCRLALGALRPSLGGARGARPEDEPREEHRTPGHASAAIQHSPFSDGPRAEASEDLAARSPGAAGRNRRR
jgi:hypothetical protein